MRSQLMSLQLMTELSLLLDQHDLALRALGKAAGAGLIDVTWLRSCPLFAPITGDLRWRAVHDAVERRAAAMLAVFRAAAG
jgi:eukaryotic-like serine/threonine-protein kinase